MKKIGNNFLFVVTFLFPFVMAFGTAKITVQANVDRDQMAIGDSFTLNLVVQSDEEIELSNPPQVSAVPGLELLNSWSGGTQSRSGMSIINGKTQFSKTVIQDFNYQFSPQKEGTFSIPMIDVQVGGQSYKTNPIKIQVNESFRNTGKKRSQKVPGRPQYQEDEDSNPLQQVPDADDLFNQLMQQRQRLMGQIQGGQAFNGHSQPQGIPNLKFDINTNEAFFIYVDLDKTEVYEGEQVTANWYLYTRGQMESLDRAKFPDLKGFWKEIIEEVPSLQLSPVIVNGVNYQRALLASHALFPIKAGVAVVDEFRIKGKVRLPTQYGYGQLNEYTKTSRRTAIKVLPLPQEGKTIAFSGAVGSYRVQVKTDGVSFPAHQPFSVKVRFEGTGNAKLIDLPPITWPEGLEVFDTKNESKFFKDGQSFKEFEILLIPRKEGELKIPPMNFTYFDPTQKKYVNEQTEAITLNITPGNAQSAPTAAVTPSEKSAAGGIAEVYRTQPILELPQSSFSFSAYRLTIYVAMAAFILFSFLIQFLMQFRKFNQAPEFQQMVEAKLKAIDYALAKSDHKKIGSESLNLIYLLAASLAGQRRADQEWSELIKEIPAKTQNQFLGRLTDQFDYFQLLGFSPEDVVQLLLNSKPLTNQITELKKITKEISIKAKTDERE
ncbi:MAG: protein BatD [Bdellovibrio sp.]|nr:protein BatD [Bdellovibrio sp.]